VKRFRQFIKESWSELKKVSWPNRLQVRNLTILVFVVSFVVGLYITVADTFFLKLIELISQAAA
jgi:preprotein translocase subunit SecE